MAAIDEMLEDEPSSWTLQLVGACRVAAGLDRFVAIETEANEWPEIHLAPIDVFRPVFRKAVGEDGKDLPGKTDPNQESQGIDFVFETGLPPKLPRRQWRSR